MMRDEPFYALLSVFHSQDTPGVGTFYDFQDRLLQRPRQPRTTRRRPYRSRDQRSSPALTSAMAAPIHPTDGFIYTYPQENYRLHTLIPRDSDLWKYHQDARSCAESSVKWKKYDFHLLQTRAAGRDRWLRRLHTVGQSVV